MLTLAGHKSPAQTFASVFKLGLITFVMALSPLQLAHADSDYLDARRLVEAGDILPLATILQKAREIRQGKVLEVELETKNNLIIYEIELLTGDGIVLELLLNARTGHLIQIKEDD